MLASVAFALSHNSTSGKMLMEEAMKYYQSLASVQMEIVHNNTSGLFPGRYEQSLKVKEGGRFELKLTKAHEGQDVPDYYCDGKMVLAKFKSGRTLVDEIAQENTVPGWEISTGLVLSWMLKTPQGNTWVNGAPGWEMNFSAVTEAKWRGRDARQVVLDMGAAGNPVRFAMTIYMEKERPLIMGWTSANFNGKPLELQFNNIKVNPPLPENLGDHPAN